MGIICSAMSHEADVDQAEALKRACVLRRKYLAQQRATLVIEAREPSNRPRLKFLVPRIKQITAQMDKLEVCEGMYEQVNGIKETSEILTAVKTHLDTSKVIDGLPSIDDIQDIQDVFATSNEAFADINEVFNESWSGSPHEASMQPEDLEAELDAILGLQSNPEPPAPPPSSMGMLEAEKKTAVRVPMAPLAPVITTTLSTDSLPSTPNETPVPPGRDSSPPTYSNTESRALSKQPQLA